jgi:hypothetical protein
MRASAPLSQRRLCSATDRLGSTTDRHEKAIAPHGRSLGITVMRFAEAETHPTTMTD